MPTVRWSGPLILGLLFAAACSGNSEKSAGTTVSTGGTSAQLGSGGAAPTSAGGVVGPVSNAGGTPSPVAGGMNGSPMGSGGSVQSGGGPSAGSAGVGRGGAAEGTGGMPGGSGGATSGSGGSTPSGGCGSLEMQPFGCKFAWGTNEPKDALSSLGYLDFISKWIGWEIKADGTFANCDGCTWLASMAQTSLVPVYYAYFIGYLGHANGLPDGNENPNGPNLTTDAALLIRSKRAALVSAYGEYAQRSRAAWPTRPLVWLLEGDFVQYSGTSQKQPLSYSELGELARDITCAIKSNMPNAIVAINHSTWNPDQVTMDFWGAMKNVSYDLVWTTGVAGNNGFFESGTNTSSYNHTTATYRFVHMLTGKPIFVDTSFGLSAMADSWSGAAASTINSRASEGVIAANVATPDSSYASRLNALRAGIDPICH